jgi:lysyl-tRNA synthetase class 2
MAESWWLPARHHDRRPGLLARNRVRSRLRTHFEDQGFAEVEAAALQISPGNELHVHAFASQIRAADGRARPVYLHTSPEFALKKLLAAGERKIFDFARVFRNREAGRLHASEFVMLEWYRAGEDYTALMADCEAILRLAAEAAGADSLRHLDRAADPFAPVERISVAQAFDRHAGIDLMATLTDDGEGIQAMLATAAENAGVRVAADDTWSDVFTRVMAERVEPAIGNGRATILYGYPLPEAALAMRTADDPRLALRFELFACGVELANAFGELRDADEQRRRFTAAMTEKARLYDESYPIDEDFLAALAAMPEASGCALGFDRLIMLLLGSPRIADVQWTPAQEAP